jgi:hypothetical protein
MRTANRVVAFLLAAAALALLLVTVRALAAGVPVRDHWLFPVMVVLPALAAMALALSLRASPVTRANIALLGVAVIIGLYAVDAVLELLPESTDPPGPAVAGRSVDTRTRLRVAADLRAAGTDALSLIGGRALRSSPPLGPGVVLNGRAVAPLAQPVNRVIVGCNENGRFPLLHTDERGFNNPPGSWQLPIQVALVGDSYVEGSCIDPADNLVAGVRREIPGTVGLGLSDSGPLVMLGMIKEYLTDVRPRDVFWFFYEGNDLRNLTSELQSPELRQYLEPGRTQQLRALQSEIDSVLVTFMHTLLARPPEEEPAAAATDTRPSGSRLRRWLRLHRLRSTLGLSNINSQLRACCDPAAFAAVLAEADRTVREWGGRLHFVYLPAAGRYAHPMSALIDDNLRYRGQVLRVVRRLGLPIIDVHAVFQATGHPDSLFFHARSHFNEAGYRVAADAVVRHLATQKH